MSASLTKSQRRRLKLQMEREKQAEEDKFLDGMIQEVKTLAGEVKEPLDAVPEETFIKPDQ